jgi:hypothetical protein
MGTVEVNGSKIGIHELMLEDEGASGSLAQYKSEERSGIIRKALQIGLESMESEPGEWTPFWEYLKSPQGHEVASRVLALFEEIKKATLDKSAEQGRLQAELSHRQGRNLLVLQEVVFGTVVLAVSGLTYVGKFEPALGVLLGTLVGYFFGRR